MPHLITMPPFTPVEPVSEILHGFSITDPYRWLEDQDSPRTRQWIRAQQRYARSYLDSLPGRQRIRSRLRELLDIETYDSFHKSGSRYYFRKRSRGQEQPCIFFREGPEGTDQLLVDPAERAAGVYTAAKPLQVSPDGRFLLYEVKHGGERTGSFELIEVGTRTVKTDKLGRGYLRGFAFTPNGEGFYYIHEYAGARPCRQAVHRHLFGSPFTQDVEIFSTEDDRSRVFLTSDATHLGILVYNSRESTNKDFLIKELLDSRPPETVIAGAEYSFFPALTVDKILAITDRDAPNGRIVEIRKTGRGIAELVEVVPEKTWHINQWLVTKSRLLVSYIRETTTEVNIFDFEGRKTGEIPVSEGETVRLLCSSGDSDEVLIESESLNDPSKIFRYEAASGRRALWCERESSFDGASYQREKVTYTSKDGTCIPMTLMARKDLIGGGSHPTIMTAYGGFAQSMTPQFSVLVAFLVERGCLFALPNIRGGAEFGVQWHNMAKGRNRQKAYDDFLGAAAWLIETRKTTQEQLGIFGGSNSGLLVGVAITQRPDLFRAALCLVPLLDMLRYHLFDNADNWEAEYGTANDEKDFAVLAAYSPYHQVQSGCSYPATLIVSGDADGKCNAMHARKMIARLQAANVSPYPIILDYDVHRGHSPVLPLTTRINALTDRVAFLCDQLGVPA